MGYQLSRLRDYLADLFSDLPKRAWLTLRYHGWRSVLFRIVTFPLRLTPLGPRIGPGGGQRRRDPPEQRHDREEGLARGPPAHGLYARGEGRRRGAEAALPGRHDPVGRHVPEPRRAGVVRPPVSLQAGGPRRRQRRL